MMSSMTQKIGQKIGLDDSSNNLSKIKDFCHTKLHPQIVANLRDINLLFEPRI